ncbi:acyltransferase [Allostella vacuolata]|nr:acyltransferase [Stella vacuolata]
MIRNIQALRFLAAFAVLAYHAGTQYFAIGTGTWLGPFLAAFTPYGMAGVDVFFVISGYIIWHATRGRQGPADAAAFLVTRLARVYLGYWPWLVIAVLLAHLVDGADFARFNLQGSLFLFPLGGTLVIIVAWTLTLEVMFYLVFAASMLLPRPAILAVLALWSACALAVMGKGSLWLTPYALEFAAGALLAAAVARFGAPRPSWSLAALAATLVMAVGWHSETILERVLVVGPFGVAAVALAVALEARGWTAGRALVVLGDASYALYLCHLPIMLAVIRLLSRPVAENPDLAFAAMMLATVLVSVGWYLAVERHVTAATRAAVRQLLPVRPRRLATLGA